MRASSKIGRYPSEGSTLMPVEGLLLAMTVVVFAVVAPASSALTCPSYTTDYHSSSTNPVPCSDTETCFSAAVSFECLNTDPIEGYMNASPPSVWYNCTPLSGGGSCSEDVTACGFTVWFPSYPSCSTSCRVSPTRSIAFCRSPAP